MQDVRSLLATLSRPRLLIRAARHGMLDYHRDRDLRRLIHSGRVPTSETAVKRLLDVEQDCEMKRKNGDVAYSISHHVDLLIALMAEVKLIATRTAA